MSSLRRQIGRLMIVGLAGPELTALEEAWLKLIRPAGVILFRRNIESAAQTTALLQAIRTLLGESCFCCVDLEGGLVDRLRDAVAPMPSLAAVAATRNPRNYRRHGELIARGARAFGFNTAFAPVLDLASPASRPVMRTRTFFEDPEDVITYASAFLDGLRREDVLGCGKHFPGLGGGALDSHANTPVIDRTWAELWRDDMLPYRKLRARLPMIMVSHASYPKVGDSQPASISEYWIGEVLSRRIRHRGLILSDDLEMGGILTGMSIEDAAVQAIAAGTHLIEVCKDPSFVIRAYDAVLSEAERSRALRKNVQNASTKVATVLKKLPRPRMKAPSEKQLSKLRDEVARLHRLCPEPEAQTI